MTGVGAIDRAADPPRRRDDPHTALFDAHVRLEKPSHVLVSNIDDCDLIAAMAERAVSVAILHRNWSVLQRLHERFGSHRNIEIGESVFPSDDAAFDAALVQIPKGRGLARAMLFTALRTLPAGASLWAAGPNQGGAKTAQTDMRLVAETQTLATRARHRILAIRRGRKLEAPPEWNAPWRAVKRTFTVSGSAYHIYTQPGIFSWDHLDEGTVFLIDHLPMLDLPAGGRVLDAACGYGILGMVAERELRPAEVVWADVDLLAVQCAAAALPGKAVVPADLMQSVPGAEEGYDLILCNPPFHQEHARDTTFMRTFAPRARRALRPRGRLVLVANRFLPYSKVLKDCFNVVERPAADGRFQILLCRQEGTPPHQR